ncbi:YbaB/EbfC family nucleoid-associated protein [Bailinhaonella thermotolerans]|uniref:Nucleoid-associated protein D5H75_16730 n=1 Tax=Bailinhaonella thermotolerans TaxID=1070861 RepID=A0A3A4B1U5_9ACTN|nr:YbaB/EbfC family nucleoid-associated protein [Bailinhaonella thermotolerans]RJL32073.1 YbaB/EbfC family nucleoid-associated protein [Bailinhaonella thermotolerans]
MNPGDVNLQQMLEQAQMMQQQLLSAQQELSEAEVEGTAGGGLVTATVSGSGELLSLRIDPKVIDPGDAADTAETIADLVMAAVRDAVRAASDLQQEKLGPFTQALGGFGGGAPGGMPGLPGF